MSTDSTRPPDMYVSQTGVVREHRELEREAWEHSTPTDLSNPPITVDGVHYYPVDTHDAFAITYTPRDDTDASTLTEPITRQVSDVPTDEHQSTDAVTQIAETLHRPSTQARTRGRSTASQAGSTTVTVVFLTRTGHEQRQLPVDRIHYVEPVTDLPDRFAPVRTQPRAQATEIEGYAGMHPGTVTPKHVIRLLTLPGASDETTRAATAALRHIIDHRAEECTHAVRPLTTLIRHADTPTTPVVKDAVYCLAELATTAPSDTALATDAITPHLTNPETEPETQTHILQAIAEIAASDPDYLTRHTEHIATHITCDTPDHRILTARTFSELAAEYPTAVTPYTETLLNRLGTLTTPADTREAIAVMSTASRLAVDSPSPVIEHVDTLTEYIDASDPQLQQNTLAAVYRVAKHDPVSIVPEIPQIARQLTSPEPIPGVKRNAVAVLSELAITHPSRIEAYCDVIARCLTADTPETRMNACWALQRLGSVPDPAQEHLERVVETDQNESVRNRAAQALNTIRRDTSQ